MNQEKNNSPKLSEHILNDQLLLAGFSVALILLMSQLIIIALYIWRLPPEVPLFYSLLTGADQLANRLWLLGIPIISIMSVLLSFVLIRISPHVIITFHQILTWFSALIVLLGTISLVHSIILVY